MYQYIFINDGIACEFIPEENPDFPGVSVSERYASDFLSHCVKRTDEQIKTEGIRFGMRYDAQTDSFSLPPELDTSDKDEEKDEVPE